MCLQVKERPLFRWRAEFPKPSHLVPFAVNLLDAGYRVSPDAKSGSVTVQQVALHRPQPAAGHAVAVDPAQLKATTCADSCSCKECSPGPSPNRSYSNRDDCYGSDDEAYLNDVYAEEWSRQLLADPKDLFRGDSHRR